MNPVIAKAALRLATSRRGRKWALLGVLMGVSVPVIIVGVPVALIMVVVGGFSGGASADPLPPGCDDPRFEVSAGVSIDGLTDEQIENAATIIQEAQAAGVPEYGWVVGLATAMQESKLRNISYGDRDSVGLFQQRAGWGSVDERMDPATSSQYFFTGGSDAGDEYSEPGLLDIDGWESMAVTDAAQAVQRSAFPYEYAQWEPIARALVVEVGGGVGDQCGDGNGMVCPETGLDAEQGLKPDGVRVVRCLVQNFPQIETYLGVGDRPSNGDSDHPDGRAVDAMVPGWDTPAGNTLGWEIAEWLRSNAGALGVKYLIFDAKIWSAERGDTEWRDYQHPSGADDPTSAHRDHVHVSVYGNAAGNDGQIGEIALPVEPQAYHLTARFGDCGGRWADCHTGLDFAANPGTPVRAIAAGEVVSIGDGGAYGNLMKIQHEGGTQSWYAHLPSPSSFPVREGDVVAAGQVVAAVGATGNVTGPHLHLEIREGGRPVDPERWFDARGLSP